MDPTIVQRVRIIIMQHRQLQGSGSPMRFQRMEVFQNAAVTLSGLLDDSKIVEYSSRSFHDGHTLFSFSEQYEGSTLLHDLRRVHSRLSNTHNGAGAGCTPRASNAHRMIACVQD